MVKQNGKERVSIRMYAFMLQRNFVRSCMMPLWTATSRKSHESWHGWSRPQFKATQSGEHTAG